MIVTPLNTCLAHLAPWMPRFADTGYTLQMQWDDLPSSSQSDLFGGQGTVRVWDLLSGASPPPFSAVLRCELAPGASVGPHTQQRDPELVICLEGEGTISVNKQSAPFTPGRLAYLPHGSILAIDNSASDVPLRYFIIKARQQA
ncbi:MAG: quercetin dioxygenase-like cupin family protein [Myxococcota bacterium]|jgi:quercetin dioxygenase-like cupin family protein